MTHEILINVTPQETRVAMLEQGVYLAPSAYEAGFVSAAHGEAEIDATLAAARAAFTKLR